VGSPGPASRHAKFGNRPLDRAGELAVPLQAPAFGSPALALSPAAAGVVYQRFLDWTAALDPFDEAREVTDEPHRDDLAW